MQNLDLVILLETHPTGSVADDMSSKWATELLTTGRPGNPTSAWGVIYGGNFNPDEDTGVSGTLQMQDPDEIHEALRALAHADWAAAFAAFRTATEILLPRFATGEIEAYRLRISWQKEINSTQEV